MSKVAIVTGGSFGIGLAIVEKLLSQEYQVFNLDIHPSPVGDYVHCDVSKVADVQKHITDIIHQTGRVDALVSNAGKHLSANIENTDETTLDSLFALNVKGAYAATKAVLPVMKQQNNGAIVYISSDQALIGKTNSFAYNLTKAALASMARTTALDYASFNIRANAVCPGTIETPLFHTAIDSYCHRSGAIKDEVVADEAKMQPLGRLGQAHEVAALVAFLLSDDASFITGSLQSIDGGYTAQ
ncbi:MULTISPECIES: SDR family NAD(P)-dependent oxidoreductase [Pseudoalteromonas]|uniref:Oxidoreductase n=1 Tax=Pseudoalteromonas amylolytica TaxID=1859457 RepID=A0A1S1MSU9_9GAMM|nr:MULTISPECIES: SDR family oxidoreductase [Pseudoalteromonas]MCF6435530.1 SDR family oxidoreductase [Pseudoalteromonas sp. MMG022]OHU86309.1 oxidoreductase [Pseudoalteromonas sp. JW3]OHU89586.1 oxidoreductase [Pseudoalteromonas amylolytica]